MQPAPREIPTAFRPIPLTLPEAMRHNEFFDGTENVEDPTRSNSLLRNRQDLLPYRKALGHGNEFDGSIIDHRSRTLLNPLGRPVRRAGRSGRSEPRRRWPAQPVADLDARGVPRDLRLRARARDPLAACPPTARLPHRRRQADRDISQHSIGNAITGLLGDVVDRIPDAQASVRCGPAWVGRLLEVRRRRVEANPGDGDATAHRPGQ